MSTPAIIRRLRKELREREDIQPNTSVILDDDPRRAANTRAAQLLLREALHGRIDIQTGPNGIRCGSREEAAILRLQEYTRTDAQAYDVLLCEIPLADLQEYLCAHGEDTDLFIPSSPERGFVDRLSEDFEDIVYGL